MRSTLQKLKLMVIIALITISTTHSQTRNHPWSVNLGVGISEYSGEKGTGFFKFDITPNEIGGVKQKNQPGIGVMSVTRYLNSKFDASLNGYWGEWGYFGSETNYFYRNSRSLGAHLRWKFLGQEDKRITPYAFTGLAFRNLAENPVNTGQNELVVPIGIGANIKFSERWGLNLSSNFGWTSGDKGEKLDGGGTDLLWNQTIGLSYLFGASLPTIGDADGDGVKDNKDQCPDTPKGAKVDKKGCIVDGDKDGVADNLDKCPAVAGLAKFDGCPDTDGDGIQDSEDKCPTVAGIAKFNGCPDSDNDGIQDSEDKCPTVAGIAKFNGCPDTDGDGIQDSEDKCPKVPGLAQFNGCPDTDGDGVQDSEDNCPTVKGTIANKGCPEEKKAPEKVTPKAPEVVTPKEPIVIEKKLPEATKKEVIVEDINYVRFEFDSHKIRQESIDRLLVAVDILKKNPNYTLILDGYTDNVGPVEYNLTLSKQRAESVKRWLVAKGIKASRITTSGYGVKNPIMTNDTEEGRFENRRVELKSKYILSN